MNNIAFDTHEFVEGLTRAKMPKQQAEFLAKSYVTLLNDRIATKDDLGVLRSELKNLENRMTIKLLASQLALLVIMLGAFNYFN